MSALYIALEQEDADFNAEVSGKALSKHEEKLDQIAKQLSVTPLMEFFSVDPEEAAGIVEDSGGDPSSMVFEEMQWHEASAGLTSIRALRQFAAEHPSMVPDSAAVLEELAEFERVLQSAQTRSIRWRLAVDY